MILLATFTNELEAQLLESQLKGAGIEYRTMNDDTKGVASETVKIMVFEDDLEEAREIMEARAMEDDDYMPGLAEDADLDDLSDEDI